MRGVRLPRILRGPRVAIPTARAGRAPARIRRRLGRFTRPSWRALAGALGVLVVLGLLVGGLAQMRVSTDVDSFVPASDPSVDQLHAYARTFGADPVVVLLESPQPQGLLGQDQLPRLLRLEGQLSAMPDAAAVYGPATVLNQLAGRAQDMVTELVGRRDGLRKTAEAQAERQGASDANAAHAADSASADFDARYGSLLVRAMPAGLPTLRNPQFVRTALYDPQGQPRPQWKFVLPSSQSAAILVRPREGLDQAGNERLVDSIRSAVTGAGLATSRVTVSGAPAVVAGLGAQVRREAPLVGGVAILAVGLCFWLTPWARRRRRLLPVGVALLATAATVSALGWIGRPVSLGVVAFLPVLLGVGSYYPTYFSQHARRGLIGVVAAATACSFGALGLSPLPFVRDLGLALAVGVLVACGLGALIVRRSGPESDQPAPRRSGARRPSGAASRRARMAALAGAVVVASTGWVALASIPLQTDFSSFTAGLDVGRDLDHVAQTMGTTGEVDLALHGPDVTSPEAMAWMRQAQDTITLRHGDVLRPATTPASLLDFLGPQPTAEQIGAGLRITPPYLVGSVIGSDHTLASMAFGTTESDAGQLQQLRDDVLATLPAPPPSYSVDLTGLPMLAARGQQLVSADRYLANAVGVLAAGLVLLIGLRRHRADAGRAVLAAVLATGSGLCLVWAAGLALNPVTVALGSLTSAVGCEFTVMLAEAARGGDRWLRRSVALAALTSAVGYSALVVSGLGALREFGLMLAGSVVMALLAARLVLWIFPVTPGSADGAPHTAAPAARSRGARPVHLDERSTPEKGTLTGAWT